MITFELETITPKIAGEMLETNINNRKVVKGRDYRSILRAMTDGYFKATHQPICFDENGVLIDGQHRLMAVVDSGATVQMFVARGSDPALNPFHDIGRKRGAVDVFRELKKDEAAVSGALLLLMVGGKDMGHPDRLAMYRAFSSEIDSIVSFKSSARKIKNATFMAAAVYALVRGEPAGFVVDTYHNMVMKNFSQLHKSCDQYLRSIGEGESYGQSRRSLTVMGGDARIEKFVRALNIFLYAKKDLTRTPVDADSVKRVIAEVRMAMAPRYEEELRRIMTDIG